MTSPALDLRCELEEHIDQLCTRLELCGMKGCDEGFDATDTNGFLTATWGIVFHFQDRTPLWLTWDASAVRGDPYCIAAWPLDNLRDDESVELFDVSSSEPWSRCVGKRLRRYEVLSYPTTYPDSSTVAGEPGPSRDVEWCVVLHFGAPLLIGAVYPDNVFDAFPAGDEVVIAYDGAVIERMKKARMTADQNVIEYQVSRAELIALLWRIGLRLAIVAPLIVVGLCGIAIDIATPDFTAWAWALVAFPIVAAVMYRRAIRRAVDQHPEFLEPQRVSFDDAGLTFVNSVMTVHWPWSRVRTVTDTSKHLIFRVDTFGSGGFIPKRALSDEQYERVMACASDGGVKLRRG